MDIKHDGGSAFPQIETEIRPSVMGPRHFVYSRGGMSLRDYFAAEAMAEAIRALRNVRASMIAPPPFDCDLVATTAYVLADAMLKARQR